MKLHKLNRNIHRDLGYIFFFLTIVYGLSGVALNHIHDWNPSYIVKNYDIQIEKENLVKEKLNRNTVIKLIEHYAEGETYKNHYFPNDSNIKIFIKDGSVNVDLETGAGFIETSKRRPILHEVNYLHYNPKKWWTLISDIYAISLMILAITGLFILKGKNGILRRGAWLTAIGIIIPIVFMLLYYWKVF